MRQATASALCSAALCCRVLSACGAIPAAHSLLLYCPFTLAALSYSAMCLYAGRRNERAARPASRNANAFAFCGDSLDGCLLNGRRRAWPA